MPHPANKALAVHFIVTVPKMNQLVYVFGHSGQVPTTIHGHVWVSKSAVRFDLGRPWIARDVQTNSVVGIVLVKQENIVLVYVRPGAGVVEHEEPRLRAKRLKNC